ncbi:dTDP-4-dehydrorhamnose reductase [Patescibacteria group bacterium]|nr:dTDP-4-dehydrorhamnose reductase [Candidatus Falkowbacteria bacterium]MBU3905812.1 dTDP-4-dehydrorhamnose reductase [Patescibacteria group bacterium]MBU4015393.1 dTDP-4-dehydrorhamnose reductase [Patescibacteria group bacterium]MBU4026007.1 dTDP-4-dehydrorhamnose reductase [Patescibacteria group bacterium]MBU4072909.1 dTDP-4-dehydrorhamnose reductase [Patescibacteria group bacterium]
MRKKILILGAKGSLGGQLIKIFNADCEVVVWGRGEIDITDNELILKKIKDVKPDVIINAAAYNAVDRCETDEQEFELAKKLNGDAVGFLAQAAIEVGAILVHYSTDYVFGGIANEANNERMKQIKKQGGFKEDDKPCPVNKYGETKLMGEQEIIKRSGQGLKWYLIRTSKLFGPKGESELAKPSFFDVILQLSKKRDCIDAVNGEMSCFTYTIDLAKATKKLIDENYGYGIYNIINSGSCTWYEAAAELFKIAGLNVKVNRVSADKFPRPAKRPKYSVLQNTKFEQLRSWKEALREYLGK